MGKLTGLFHEAVDEVGQQRRKNKIEAAMDAIAEADHECYDMIVELAATDISTARLSKVLTKVMGELEPGWRTADSTVGEWRATL